MFLAQMLVKMVFLVYFSFTYECRDGTPSFPSTQHVTTDGAFKSVSLRSISYSVDTSFLTSLEINRNNENVV